MADFIAIFCLVAFLAIGFVVFVRRMFFTAEWEMSSLSGGRASSRIESEIKKCFAEMEFTHDRVLDAMNKFVPSDVWATLCDMLKREILIESEDKERGFVYKIA